MSPSSSHSGSAPLPSADSGRPRTPEAAQNTAPPGNDPNSTPAKASATATAHAFDRPANKDLRAVYTGLEGMKFNIAQVTLKDFLEEYLPGKDEPGKNIPTQHLDKLHYVSKFGSIKSEWEINRHICQIGDKVASCNLDEEDEPPIAMRDVANWSVSDKKPRENSGTRSNTQNTAAGDEAEQGKPADDPNNATRVHVGVFFNDERYDGIVIKDPDEFMKKSKMKKSNKSRRKDWVGNCSWADAVIPIEVKLDSTRSAFYFDGNPEKFLRTDSNEGREALGQIAEYVGQIFGHQHRKHLYAVYVQKDRARLLYFDRQGCIVSESFNWGTRHDLTLHTFFWRIASMTREELGFDPTVVLATPDEVDAMLKYAPNAPTDYIEQQIYHALSRDPDDLQAGPTSTQWPPYKLTMCGKQYVIGRPTFASPALYGRCTRGYLAYSLDDKVVRFIKESWRLDLERLQPEHEVYERFKCKGVSSGILTCLAYEDVPNPDGSWQLTKTHGAFHRPRPARGHYRLLFKEVCRPLTDFNFEEFTMVMLDAVLAHQAAWDEAGVMHRDVATNNIMIYEEGRGKSTTRVGILCDWDLCKYAEQMAPDHQPRTPDRTGTWYYRSALSLQFPGKPYMLSDDIESTYDFVRVRQSDGAHIGGKNKLTQMRSSEPPMKVFNNPTLDQLLVGMALLCSEHYSTIDLDAYRQDYDPPQKRDVVLKKGGETRHAQLAKLRLAKLKRSRSDGSPEGANVEPVRPFVTRRSVAAKPLLNDHQALLDLLVRYSSGVPDEKGTVVRWPEESTKCEDLFKGTRVAPRKNNNFSSSYPSRDYSYSQDAEEPPAKRLRTASEGSTLDDVAETREEEEEEHSPGLEHSQSGSGSGDSVEGAPPVGHGVSSDGLDWD